MALNGIDISAFQSGINVPGLSTTDFVIVKTTQGTDYVSSCADSQIQSTLNSGKLMGFYHFADGGGDAVAEANYFYAQSKGYFGKGIPVLDFEVSVANPVTWCKTFLDRIYTLTGVRCLIYMNLSTARSSDWSSVSANYGLWGAAYPSSGATGYYAPSETYSWGSWGSNITIRQYSEAGRITGYSGNLDLDIAYLDKAGWARIATGDNTAESILTGSDNNMVCYFEVSGAGFPMMYFDGSVIKAMDADMFAIVKALYKTANGKDMPGRKITKAEYTALKKLTESSKSVYVVK